jgi:hypothetical protein
VPPSAVTIAAAGGQGGGATLSRGAEPEAVPPVGAAVLGAALDDGVVLPVVGPGVG